MCAIIVLLLVVISFVLNEYKITTVYVDGNTHYTDEEIRNMVIDGWLSDNSLVLSLKYRQRKVKDVPFVSKMDVTVTDPHTIRISVYEKAVAGYVEYLEKYMYFDRDGIIVESSNQRTKGVPQVTGLDFDHVVIYEVLPVEDPSVFSSILTITQLVNKYELQVDKIYFAKDGTITLYFEEVRVALGNDDKIEEKVMKLEYILPNLEGKKGVLRMENYNEDSGSVSFEPDEEFKEEDEIEEEIS